MQFVDEVLPAGDCAAVLQSEHAAGPTASLYVFGPHTVHVPPFGPVYPALHWQLVTAVLPAREIEFARHTEQAAGPTVSL